MAGVNAVAQTVQITTGTSLITLMQIVAATNQRVKVKDNKIATYRVRFEVIFILD